MVLYLLLRTIPFKLLVNFKADSLGCYLLLGLIIHYLPPSLAGSVGDGGYSSMTAMTLV